VEPVLSDPLSQVIGYTTISFKIRTNCCEIKFAIVCLPSGLFIRFVQTPPYRSAENLALAQFPERQGQTRFLANSSALQLGQAFRHLSGAAPESAEALVLDVSRGALMDAAALDDALEDLVRKPHSHLSPF
jgi:hypothetical protein